MLDYIDKLYNKCKDDISYLPPKMYDIVY